MADIDRPLNKRGRRSGAVLAGWLAQHGPRPALVLCSTARRTRETLDLLYDALGPRTTVCLEPELYLADAPTLLARLRQVDDAVPSVLLIAHNPGLQELAVTLAGAPGAASPEARGALERKFPTAALVRFGIKGRSWAALSPHAPAEAIKLLEFTTPARIERRT